MNRSVILIVTLLTAAAVQRPTWSQDPKQADHATIRVEHNAEAFVTSIWIRADDDRVAWSDVLRGLARARGFDDAALEGVLPKGRFRVTGIRAFLVRMGLNLGFGKHVRFSVERPEDRSGEPWLVIRLDRQAILASKRKFKAWLRQWLLSTRKGFKRSKVGLEPDEGWNEAPAERDLVVALHGLGASPENVEGLLAGPRKEGLPCAVFCYPNDQPLDDSAKLLARELAELAQEHPDRGVSLVTHSMGGLVARAVIENADLDPGNVRRLIMIAPPNHGSTLAHFAFGIELWEQLADGSRRSAIGRFYASIEDGLAEAAVDLRPGSVFLGELNARDRNPKIRYTIFLGTGARLTENELALLREGIARAGRKSRWVQLLGSRAHEWLSDLDEVVAGKGDGVVSVARGRLEGVDDVLVLDFGHASVLRAAGGDDVDRVHREVLRRLKELPRPVD
ncbi:MAG: esterase/lipase family protein [Planctomycetota bacterium]|jgi:pimeloyl-ACP methyl ester carboxylesterase